MNAPYKPDKPRKHLTKAGAAKIGQAQHKRKIERLVKATGLSESDVERKLALGMGWCKAHGWRPWARCDRCRIEDTKKRRKKAAQVVSELREQSPLGQLVQTGRELREQQERQLSFSFEPKRSKRK